MTWEASKSTRLSCFVQIIYRQAFSHLLGIIHRPGLVCFSCTMPCQAVMTCRG